MNLVVHHEAECEFFEAIAYYEGCEEGLGLRFKREVEAFVEKIADDPARPRLRAGGYRRVNLSVFPYYLAYIIRDQTIWIVAIAHEHRQPEFWAERTPDTHS